MMIRVTLEDASALPMGPASLAMKSAKAHYALKWLISRQGRVFIERTDGTDSRGLGYFRSRAIRRMTPVMLLVWMFFLTMIMFRFIPQDDALKPNKNSGIQSIPEDMADVVVIALNSATTGRMAISLSRTERL